MRSHIGAIPCSKLLSLALKPWLWKAYQEGRGCHDHDHDLSRLKVQNGGSAGKLGACLAADLPGVEYAYLSVHNAYVLAHPWLYPAPAMENPSPTLQAEEQEVKHLD